MPYPFPKNIGYHTVDYNNPTKRLVGGSFGGDLSLDTANRLVRANKFTVQFKNSGTPVFVDDSGRMVRLYLSVDVESTDIGKAAIEQHRLAKRARDEAIEKVKDRVDELVDDLPPEVALQALEQALKTLKGGS